MPSELMKQELQEYSVVANEIIVSSEISYNHAAELLKGIKELAAKVKETFDPICEKANKAHKEATGKRKEHLEPLEKAEKLIKQKMLEYSGENEVQKVAGISTSSTWKAVIVDESKIPRKYLIPDMKVLNALAKASKDLIKVPGVEFIEDRSMTIR